MAGYIGKPWRPALPLLLSLSVACGLTGCESREQLRQAQEQRCTSSGLQPGTVPFADCLQRESLAESYQRDQAAGTSWGPSHPVPAYAISGAAQ
jgi:hypothetical protein